MSLITRCPACGTLFRVVPDQLKMAEGWVRCGHCSEVFDAQLSLQTVPVAPAVAPAGPEAGGAVLPATLRSLLLWIGSVDAPRPHLPLVLVDDGSTDGSLKLLRDYAARDPRVRVRAAGRSLGARAPVARRTPRTAPRTRPTRSSSGGGGGGSASVPQPPAGPTQLQLDNMAASRFLAQAAWGGHTTLIDTVRTTGARAWLQSEMSRPVSSSMKSWLIAKGYNDASVTSNVNGEGGWVNAMWAKLFAGNDAVRQRAVLAWSEIFVVSALGLPISWRNFALANHWENLEKHAFGNFRNLLIEVAKDPAMVVWLDGRTNVRARPQENFAREVMELFTFGVANYVAFALGKPVSRVIPAAGGTAPFTCTRPNSLPGPIAKPRTATTR